MVSTPPPQNKKTVFGLFFFVNFKQHKTPYLPKVINSSQFKFHTTLIIIMSCYGLLVSGSASKLLEYNKSTPIPHSISMLITSVPAKFPKLAN